MTICLCYFRQYLEENQGKGAGVITSEALQPIYELKHVAERSSKSSEEVLTKLSMVSNAYNNCCVYNRMFFHLPAVTGILVPPTPCMSVVCHYLPPGITGLWPGDRGIFVQLVPPETGECC